ncbi:MAG: Bifunctional protein GlmU [Elusimicrobia bacterium]|nr:Bifunctional protein GlmU [Elusimicrobiota bacterium]
MKPISILILAAGKGTRMKSSLPKVLHPVCGIPMVERVVRTGQFVRPSSVCVVVGHGGEQVKQVIHQKFPKTQFVSQSVQDGSGGAVRQALSWLKKQKGLVLLACGDAPLISAQSFKELIHAHVKDNNRATVLTTKMPNPYGYGRILRSKDGSVEKIVEHLDANPRELEINEINTGTYCFDAAALAHVIPKLKNNNVKKEYYLTDTLELLRQEGGRIGGLICVDPDETMGINSRAELAKAEIALYRRKAEALMAAGVTIVDPKSTYVADTVKVGSDTVLWPQTFLLGQTKVGSGCQIGPWAHIQDTQIENRVIFQSSFSEGALIRSGARVGPYSRVRPGSEVGRNAHLGNFSEIKKSTLGEGSKANHLTYLGDATIGKNVNIGAGTITCNYDGVKKYPTQIQDNAFIGSNVNLIAPVRVGAHAVVGAGSSINKDVPAWSLALERSVQVTKKNWAKASKRKGKK